MADAQIHRHYPAIAEELFGEEAYVDRDADNWILLLHVNRFMDAYMAKHWHALRALFMREQKRMQKYRRELDKEWTCKCRFP